MPQGNQLPHNVDMYETNLPVSREHAELSVLREYYYVVAVDARYPSTHDLHRSLSSTQEVRRKPEGLR